MENNVKEKPIQEFSPKGKIQSNNIGYSRQAIAGESRLQYIPYEKTIIQYEPVTTIEYVPREKKIIQYYPVEYQTEYVPQVYHQKVIQYVPVQRMQERIQYVPVERQIYHPPQEQPYQISENPPVRNKNSRSPQISYHPITTNSRIQPQYFGQNIQYPPPHNNSHYVKQPLPSSKRYHYE